MASPSKINFNMYQGATFSEVIRWESSNKAYAPITGITKAAPMVVTSSAHTIPAGWRVKVTNVVGMKEINSADNYQIATSVAANTLTFANVNSLGYTDYVSGGVLEYNTPISLTGYTARMQLREKIDSTTVLAEYTTVNGNIQMDVPNSAITILIDAATTAGYTFNSAVYSLELVSSTGVVTQLASGTIKLIKEVTR